MSKVIGIVVPLIRDGSIPTPLYEITRDDAELDMGYSCIALADGFSEFIESKHE